MENKTKEFKQKLSELLKEYNAKMYDISRADIAEIRFTDVHENMLFIESLDYVVAIRKGQIICFTLNKSFRL